MRKNSAMQKQATFNHPHPYNACRMIEPPNQIIYVNINTRKRGKRRLCSATGHFCQNCPWKKSKGGGDEPAKKKDAVPGPVWLEYEGDTIL